MQIVKACLHIARWWARRRSPCRSPDTRRPASWWDRPVGGCR